MNTNIMLLGVMFGLFACQSNETSNELVDVAPNIEVRDSLPNGHLIHDFSPYNSDGSLNVLIEIPAGTIDKAEVNKASGKLEVELINGKPRQVNYLAYPANYGLIPQTLSPKDEGGDGDPLDVIILGEGLEEERFYSCRLIGVLKLLDRGEQDDKLIAVLTEGPFSQVNSMAQLDKDFAGVSTIIETWFANYKGPGMMESKGFAEKEVADSVLSHAIASYDSTQN